MLNCILHHMRYHKNVRMSGCVCKMFSICDSIPHTNNFGLPNARVRSHKWKTDSLFLSLATRFSTLALSNFVFIYEFNHVWSDFVTVNWMNEPTRKRCTVITCIIVWIDLMELIDRKLQIQSIYLRTCSNHFNFSGMLNATKFHSNWALWTKRCPLSKYIQYAIHGVREKKSKCTYSNGSNALFWTYVFFLIITYWKIFCQLTAKSKRCSVNHKQFSTHWNRLKGKCIIL